MCRIVLKQKTCIFQHIAKPVWDLDSYFFGVVPYSTGHKLKACRFCLFSLTFFIQDSALLPLCCIPRLTKGFNAKQVQTDTYTRNYPLSEIVATHTEIWKHIQLHLGGVKATNSVERNHHVHGSCRGGKP